MSSYFFLFDTVLKSITLFLFNEHLDYVGKLFKFYMTLSKQQLHDACNDMTKMVPQPMNSMLDKQPREEAIRIREKSMNMVTTAVSPTAPSGMFCWNLKQHYLKTKVVD